MKTIHSLSPKDKGFLSGRYSRLLHRDLRPAGQEKEGGLREVLFDLCVSNGSRRCDEWALRLVLVLFLLPSVFLPGDARADMWDMASHFQVYLSAQEEYSDNIDLTSAPTRTDFITTISPGIRFSTRPRSRVAGGEFRKSAEPGEENYEITGDYRPGFVFYAKNTDLNYVSHDGSLNAWYTLDRNITFRLREYLLRSEDPKEPDYSQTAVAGQYLLGSQASRNPYFRNVLEPSVEYKFGKENLFVMSGRSNIYNTEVEGQSSREQYYSPRITYWFDLRNGASLEYGLTFGHFEDSPDLVGHSVKGRYSYRYDPKTTFFGEYTFLLRNFDTPVQRLPVPVFPPPPSLSLDYTVQNPSIGVERVFSRTFSARAQAGYFWQFPDQASQQSAPFYDITLTQKGERTTFTLSFTGGYTEDFFSAEQRGFTKSYRTIGVVSHRLAEKLTLGLTGSFDWIKYVPDEKEKYWELTGNMSYQLFRWMSLFLSFSHRENRSDGPDLLVASSRTTPSYTENRGVFRITANY
jgi:hypothetical protein